jgi:exosortase N
MMAVIFGLNIICNLCRMVLLVLFQSLPNTISHEAIGLGCLVVYIFAPLYFITKWAVGFSTTTWHTTANHLSTTAAASHTSYIYVMGLVCGVVLAVFRPNIKLENTQLPLPTPTFYHHKKLEHGVTQYISPNKLVYLKNIPSFYYTDHSPLLCWRGSGYQLSSYKEIVVQNQKVFVSTLCSNKSRLYTAWWFSNGQYRTNSQLDFRWRMLSGAPDFYVVNVTAATPSQLTALIAEWQTRF